MDSRVWFVAGTWLAHHGTAGTLHLFLHATASRWDRYKIQPEAPPPSPALVRAALLQKVTDAAVAPFLMWVVLYPLFVQRGWNVGTGVAPPVHKAVAYVTAWFAINDLVFYWVHRMMHRSRWLYRHVHAVHHRFSAPVGLAAEYAHPLEAAAANVLPTLLGPLVLVPARNHAHPALLWLYLALRVWETVDAHCGYRFPWSPWTLLRGPADRHDDHHRTRVGNYGMFVFWDRLCDTEITTTKKTSLS